MENRKKKEFGAKEGEKMVEKREKGGTGRKKTPTAFWTNRTLDVTQSLTQNQLQKSVV